MYESYFEFTKRPFAATPSSHCFFPTENTQSGFESIVSCVERASGAALVIGGSGLGKSLFLQVLGRHFQNSFSVATLESASLNSRREFLQSILFDLGLPYRGMEEGELRLTLMDYLKPGERFPNGMLLCLDEAHLLPTSLLEEARLITNLVRDGKPRVRLVLAGNQSLEERLADPKLESLHQRIAARVYLEPMNQRECREYLRRSVEFAGKTLEEVFDEDAAEAVYTATHGVPRLVNQVCDHALVLAVADGLKRITAAIINEAWSDIQRLPVQWNVLGSQTDRTNEHVIEFGSLDDSKSDDSKSDDSKSDDSEAEDDRMQQNAWSLENNTTADEEQPFVWENQVNDSGAVAADSMSSADGSDSQPPEEEPVPETTEFVFEGPSNPFLESFSDEELIVDSFSQVIGHSPRKPANPKPTARPITGETMDNFVNGPSSPAANDSTNAEHNGESDSSTADDVSTEAQDGYDAIDIEEANESIQSYFGRSSDAITFGVGQGLHAESFSPIVPDQKSASAEAEPADADDPKTTGESNPAAANPAAVNPAAVNPAAVNPVENFDSSRPENTHDVDQDATQSEPNLTPFRVSPLSAAEFSALSNLREPNGEGQAIELTHAADGSKSSEDAGSPPASTTPESNPHPEANLDSDENTASADEELIQQSVTGMQADLSSVSIEATSPEESSEVEDETTTPNGIEEAAAESVDDRDMIVVEPETAPDTNSAAQDGSESESTVSGQAKREDYHRLFDRLRKG